MTAKKHCIFPDLLIHPGETISDILKERGITQKELAQRAGVSEAFLSDVIHGKKDISKGLAIGLSYALDVSCSFWLNLQANYDAELLSLTEEESVHSEERDVLCTLYDVVTDLKNQNFLSTDQSTEQQIITLRKYFHISNLSNLKSLKTTAAIQGQPN